jgi:hypothetical protein
MADIPPLHLIAASREGDAFAEHLESYGHALLTRMLPALQPTPDEYLELAGAGPPVTYDAPDRLAADAFWYVQMRANAVYGHTLAFGFVTLYHLFERQLATALGRIDYRQKGALFANHPKRKRLQVNELVGMLRKGGVPLEPAFEKGIERLRLISNVVKHSSNDLATIAREHPDLVPGWRGGMQLTPDLLALSTDLLGAFVSTLANFWRAFPTD